MPASSAYPAGWTFAERPLTLTLLIAVAAATLLWRYVGERYLPVPELRVTAS